MALTPKVIDDCLDKLGMLRFFPTNPRVVAQVARFLNETCKTDEEAVKLISKVIERHSEWPGPSLLRDLYWDMTHPIKYATLDD
jgi:hypothetical protein